jgi:hypothetical protein
MPVETLDSAANGIGPRADESSSQGAKLLVELDFFITIRQPAVQTLPLRHPGSEGPDSNSPVFRWQFTTMLF